MRYFRIFLLHFEHVLQNRSRVFVWFLISLLNPLIYLIFWQGAISDGKNTLGLWNLSTITSYYLMIIIASSFLEVHIEEDVAYRDIQEGDLVKYLLQPLSYFQKKFIEEIPWRIMQGFLGVIVLTLFWVLTPRLVVFSSSPAIILFALTITLFGLFISYTFKMIMGLTTLWITDYRGLNNVVEFLVIMFAGIITPLEFYPTVVKQVSFALPFAYMIYYPVVAFVGNLSAIEMVRIILVQCFWLVSLFYIYKRVWHSGIRKFSGVGQ